MWELVQGFRSVGSRDHDSEAHGPLVYPQPDASLASPGQILKLPERAPVCLQSHPD